MMAVQAVCSPAALALVMLFASVMLPNLAPAWAQTVTPSALPNVPQVSPLQHMLPETEPKLGAGLPNFAPLSAGAALPAVNIFVHSVTVIGAAAFPAAQLAGLTQNLQGKSMPLATIEAARRALLDLYRGHGFVLTTVSMDINAQGDVRFIVTEGRIVAVKLSADIGPAGTTVLGFLDHIMEERPVREATLERWLLLAGQVPGVSVHAVLQADSSDPGALTLVAEVAKQTVSGLLTVDNRGLKGTGPVEGLAVLDVNSLTSLGDLTELSVFHTAGGTDNFGQAAESFFIGTHGLRIRLYAGYGKANPGGILRQIDYGSATEVFGAQLSYPVILRRNQSLTVDLRLDGTQNQINTLGERSNFDSLRVLRGEGQYAFQDLLAGNDRDALTVLNVLVSQGIPAFGASRSNRISPPAGRAQELADFYKISGSIGRTQTLFSPLPNATVALRVEAGGQYSSQILPAAEEFCLGGTRYTRGFYSCEEVGDKAAYATAELQYNTGYDFSVLSQDIELGAQFYAFYDYGESWPNLAADLHHRLSSYGGGVRLGLTRNLEFDLEADRRLTTQLSPAATGTPALSETVIYWNITARY